MNPLVIDRWVTLQHASFSAEGGVQRGPARARGRVLKSLTYRDFTITPRCFQIRGSARWTLDLLIARRSKIRAFSGPTTFPTEQAAIRGCLAFGRRIIEGRVRNCSVDDLR